MDTAEGTNLVLANLAGGLILLFGCCYVLIARNPEYYRSYISLSVAGKIIAIVSAGLPWATGQISWVLPLLASADIVFAVLFVGYLRERPAG